MAYVSWTDGTGAATLTPYKDAGNTAGTRFRSWEPWQRPAGEGAWALGDGRHYRWRFRTDYGASFELPGIQGEDVDLAMRLQDHLMGGGVVAVYTEDASGNNYTNCYLAPDGEVAIELEDRPMFEYVVRLSVVNLSSAAMLCEY